LTTVGQAGADVGLPDQAVTLATVLKSLGYATGQFGKNHLGDLNKYLPTVHGFDEFFGYLYHLDAMSDPFCNELFGREGWRFVIVQKVVAELGETAIEYPPMQVPEVRLNMLFRRIRCSPSSIAARCCLSGCVRQDALNQFVGPRSRARDGALPNMHRPHDDPSSTLASEKAQTAGSVAVSKDRRRLPSAGGARAGGAIDPTATGGTTACVDYC